MEQLKGIEEIHRILTARRLPYWLFGGWAVDFHAGRVTRPHSDIDVAVWLSDLDEARAVLEGTRWRTVTDRLTDGYVTLERGGVVTEVAVLARDDDGVIYTPVAGGRGDWPDGSFGPDVATLDGITAHVVSRASLIIDKSEPKGRPESAAKDAADIATLRALP
jgi:hypothetical protein